jgi:hypothetical protein
MDLARLHLVDVRGDTEKQAALRVTVTPEELIPRDHPIRVIKKVAGEALKRREPAALAREVR